MHALSSSDRDVPLLPSSVERATRDPKLQNIDAKPSAAQTRSTKTLTGDFVRTQLVRSLQAACDITTVNF